MKLECKCHGVSGSCTLRTCWMAMADFRKTGDYLRRKYNGAVEVTMNQDGTGFTVANKAFRKATKNDLVYFENSPDYCLQDKAAGKREGGPEEEGKLKDRVVSYACWWIAQTLLCFRGVRCVLCVLSCMTSVFCVHACQWMSVCGCNGSRITQQASPVMLVEANILLPRGYGRSVTIWPLSAYQ